MDVIKLQILTNRRDQRKMIANQFDLIDYIRLEPELDIQDVSDVKSAFSGDTSNVVLITERFLQNGYLVSKEITTKYPNKAVIILQGARAVDFTDKDKLMSGASDILSNNSDVQILTDAIYQARLENQKKQQMLREQQSVKTVNDGRVLTVFSTKGGVGKTFVSVNLAVALVKYTGKSVVLLDFDLDCGGSSIALNIKDAPTISDAVGDVYNVDVEQMLGYLTQHKSGISVLPTSGQANVSSLIGSEQIDAVIRLLRTMFDYVVIDMPGHFTEILNPAFSLAHNVLLITTPEVLAVNNVRSALFVFKELGYPMNKIKTVINKMSKSDISLKTVESTLENNVIAEIADDSKRVRKSQNEGKPYLLEYPRSSVSKSLFKLIDNLNKTTDTKSKRKKTSINSGSKPKGRFFK